MRLLIFFFVFIWSLNLVSQQEINSNINERYLEDQFYFGLSYNFVSNLPVGANQRNLSYGMMGGFLKDMPLNKNRTFGLGVGLGLSLNTYYTNLVAREVSGVIVYTIEDDVKRSKIETHLLEFPIELRWRGSTAEEYKFWRVYAGVKAAYVIGARSKVVTDDLTNGFFNTDISPFQYGLTLSFGYNTFNLHVYYALTDLFEGNASVNTETLQYSPLRVGLIFYIL